MRDRDRRRARIRAAGGVADHVGHFVNSPLLLVQAVLPGMAAHSVEHHGEPGGAWVDPRRAAP